MTTTKQIRNWMILNRDEFENATQLAEAALTDCPTLRDESIAFELAQEVFYADHE